MKLGRFAVWHGLWIPGRAGRFALQVARPFVRIVTMTPLETRYTLRLVLLLVGYAILASLALAH